LHLVHGVEAWLPHPHPDRVTCSLMMVV
jgi:hypothetical protein